MIMILTYYHSRKLGRTFRHHLEAAHLLNKYDQKHLTYIRYGCNETAILLEHLLRHSRLSGTKQDSAWSLEIKIQAMPIT